MEEPQDSGPRMDFVGFRTLHGLHGIQDLAWTSWDSGPRMDFVGYRTSHGLHGIQDSAENGTSTRQTGILFCGVLSENTNFRDNSIKWTPLGLRLVGSV